MTAATRLTPRPVVSLREVRGRTRAARARSICEGNKSQAARILGLSRQGLLSINVDFSKRMESRRADHPRLPSILTCEVICDKYRFGLVILAMRQRLQASISELSVFLQLPGRWGHVAAAGPKPGQSGSDQA